MKVSFIIYANLESLLEKMSTCHNNPKKSSTPKINKHAASRYSLFTNCSFETTKNKLDYYRGKSCMKNFCIDLREHATKIINDGKKEIIPLTNEEKNYIINKKLYMLYNVIYAKKNLVLMIKNIKRLDIIVITLEIIEELLMVFPI